MTNIIDEITVLVSFYDVPLSDAQLGVYIEALSDLDPDALHLGIVEIIKTSKWMPKVSEIREAARAAMERQNTEFVMDWHEENNERKASPWIRISAWERMAPGDVHPIDWRTCPICGIKFANWTDCPDCMRVQL